MGGTDAHGAPSQGGPGHEKRDLNLKWAWILSVGIVLMVPLTMLAMGVLFRHLSERESGAQGAPTTLVPSETNPLPPEPRLQADPVAELRQFRTEEQALLESYGWVDRGRGKVRIPVDRAIDLVAERGLPVRPAAGEEAP